MLDRQFYQNKLAKSLETVGLHDHVGLIYESTAEMLANSAAFIRLGLEQGQRCIYIAPQLTGITETWQAEGLDLEQALYSGGLMLIRPQESYLKTGYLEPDWLLHYWAEAIQLAKAAGFAGLRVASDMSWAVEGSAVARLMEYEAKFNHFLADQPLAALCQYNTQLFSPELTLNAIRTHPLILTNQMVCKNYYYIPPAEFLQGKQAADQVKRWLGNIQKRHQTEEALQQRNRDLALLNRVSMVFISTLNLDQVLAVVLEEVRQVLGVLACSAWLIDPRTNELVCRQVTDPQGKLVLGWRLPAGQGLAGWAVKQGQSLIVGDVVAENRHFKGVDEKTGLPLRSILTVPLRVKQKVIGVIQVVDTTVNRFNQTDLTLLESLAATAAAAIENVRLYEQVQQDAEAKVALLQEVNHRVKNNLAAIVGLLYAEQRRSDLENQTVYQTIMTDLVNRVQGLATVHSLLSASEWAPLHLSELTRQIIRSSLQALPRDKNIAVSVSASPILVTADQAHNLALIINELTTNTVRHALKTRDTGRIKVEISSEGSHLICVQFQDDGPGYPAEVLEFKRHGVGFDLINPLVRKSLRGELRLFNQNGAVTQIRFRAKLDLTQKEQAHGL
jgi:two-component sensor histidine kinase